MSSRFVWSEDQIEIIKAVKEDEQSENKSKLESSGEVKKDLYNICYRIIESIKKSKGVDKGKPNIYIRNKGL